MLIVGPTASGKSDLAMRLAAARSATIVSADSMQVYRGMDIGTAKPSPADRAAVPHRMLDLVDPSVDYSAADYQRDGRAALADLAGTPVVVAGGSGLHIRALFDPLTFPPHDREVRARIDGLGPAEARRRLETADPDAGSVMDLANPRRVARALEVWELTGATPSERAASPERRRVAAYEPHIPFVAVGVDPGDRLAGRVRDRVDAMLAAGLVDEVSGLAGRMGRTARQAVGYRQLLPVVAGERPLADGVAAVISATLGLAKRQRTFFRRDPRIRWLEWSDDADARYTSLCAELDTMTS